MRIRNLLLRIPQSKIEDFCQGRLSTKCNTFSKNFGWSFPTKTLSGAIIDKIFNQPNIFIGNRPEIKTFRKEKSHNVVRILVCSALPWFMRLGKVDKSV